MKIPAILAILLILCGCGHAQKEERSAIAVSFEPQAWILEQIAGDDFETVVMLPSGSDPETYQPTISNIKKIGSSKAFFSLGTSGFEKSLTENLASNFPELKVIDCTGGIEKISGTHAGNSAHDLHRHDDAETDPHLLSSIKNSIIIADNIAEALTELFPEKATEYRENALKLKQKLQQMDDSISGMGLEGKAIVIRHPSLSYFSRDYGVDQISLQANGKETSPLQLKNLLDESVSKNPAVFVAEREHASASDEETAKQLGVKTIEVSLNSSDWLDDLMRLSKEIAKR